MSPYQALREFFGGDTSSSVQSSSSTNEVEHINQELYKKGAELAERNKTLALLQKLNGVILSSITHHDEIAQQVASLIVTEGNFELVSVLLYYKNKDVLKLIGCAQANINNKDAPPIVCDTDSAEIPFTDKYNLLIQAMNEKVVKESDSIKNIFTQEQVQENESLKSVFIYPLIVRDQLIGAMVIGLRKESKYISEYEKDLMGRLAGVIGIALDNSLLYAEVQANNERLKELDILKNEFVSVASHELRTPMTAIKSYLWMALDGKGGPLTEKQKYYMDRAYLSVDRLIKMVNDMLNISRIESGRLTINIQAVAIDKLVQEVIDDVQPRAAELGVTVSLQMTTPPSPVLADADKIKEVAFNIVGNSLKFTPQGGKITITINQTETMVEVKVSDTGSGIEAEDLPKLFQKFGLLPGSYVTNQTALGTGLGLYICKSIIELHEGKIAVSSAGRGKGSEFTFSLKIFNEADLQRLSSKFAHDSGNAVDLIHSQV
jgi:signal transduction histidine kinase